MKDQKHALELGKFVVLIFTSKVFVQVSKSKKGQATDHDTHK